MNNVIGWHSMALAAAIFSCSLKLSLRSCCTPRYLMLVFHSTSCSPRTILGYWKISCPYRRSRWVDPPATLEERHMSSYLWETICRPRISPTCRSDSHLSFITGSLEHFSASSPRCRYSTSLYWTHYVCKCWSTRRIPYAYQFLPSHLWRC